jgi:leucyl-tRNA synthetase
MDTFVNSSWYFFRYCDSHNNKEIFEKEKAKYWMPVDLYIGGAEHACMHLLFHRFYTMFLHDIGLVDFDEPTPRLFNQGMINDDKGEKMSKSKGNVVEPLETMSKYGVDTTRFYMVSEASADKGFNWSDKGIQGSLRFTKKIINILNDVKFGEDSIDMKVYLNKSIKKISDYIENIELRKATIELRSLYDKILSEKTVSKKTVDIFLRLLSPFCPHITEELYEKIGHENFISLSEWPKAEEVRINNKKVSDINDKIISLINNFREKIEKSEKKKVYIYVMPFEINKFDKEKIFKESNFSIEIFAVNDSNKYDPEEKAKKAKPNMPSIYFE